MSAHLARQSTTDTRTNGEVIHTVHGVRLSTWWSLTQQCHQWLDPKRPHRRARPTLRATQTTHCARGRLLRRSRTVAQLAHERRHGAGGNQRGQLLRLIRQLA